MEGAPTFVCSRCGALHPCSPPAEALAARTDPVAMKAKADWFKAVDMIFTCAPADKERRLAHADKLCFEYYKLVGASGTWQFPSTATTVRSEMGKTGHAVVCKDGCPGSAENIVDIVPGQV